jgi:hypothetical protein
MIDVGGYVLRQLCKMCWNLVIAKQVGEWDNLDSSVRGTHIWDSIFQSKTRAHLKHLAANIMGGDIEKWDTFCLSQIIFAIFKIAEGNDTTPEEDATEWNLENATEWSGVVRPGTFRHVKVLMLKREAISLLPRVAMPIQDFTREFKILKSVLLDLSLGCADRDYVASLCSEIENYQRTGVQVGPAGAGEGTNKAPARIKRPDVSTQYCLHHDTEKLHPSAESSPEGVCHLVSCKILFDDFFLVDYFD